MRMWSIAHPFFWPFKDAQPVALIQSASKETSNQYRREVQETVVAASKSLFLKFKSRRIPVGTGIANLPVCDALHIQIAGKTLIGWKKRYER
jgi:hypothetical protein